MNRVRKRALTRRSIIVLVVLLLLVVELCRLHLRANLTSLFQVCRRFQWQSCSFFFSVCLFTCLQSISHTLALSHECTALKWDVPRIKHFSLEKSGRKRRSTIGQVYMSPESLCLLFQLHCFNISFFFSPSQNDPLNRSAEHQSSERLQIKCHFPYLTPFKGLNYY